MASNIFYIFAEATAGAHHEAADKPGLFESIGIDWKLLILQTVAFIILFLFLKKYVYPSIIKTLDEHERNIQEASDAANQAKRDAEKTEAEVEKLLSKARKDAKDIVSNAKDEATAMVEASDKKAKARAEAMVDNARDDIAKEVLAAKKALRDETLNLVADATEKVALVKTDKKTDADIIKRAVKEASKA